MGVSAGIQAGRVALACAAVLATRPAVAQPAAPDAPPAFGVAGRSPLLVLHAVGAQVYACTADPAGGAASWRFREPIAVLTEDGHTVGRHYAGPTWELNDGSAVTGRLLAQSPGAAAGDIAWLKVGVATHRGAGRLGGAALVLRLDTRGGALAGPCSTPGELRAQPYAADYAFYR